MILKCPLCNHILMPVGILNYRELSEQRETNVLFPCSYCSKVFHFILTLVKEETIKSEPHSSLSED